MMRRILLSLMLLAVSAAAGAFDYSWSAPVPGLVPDEREGASRGYLWIAPGTGKVRALVFAFQNMAEEGVFNDPAFRERMGRAGVGILWIAPGFGNEWDVSRGVQAAFDGLLSALSTESGHPEVSAVPLVPFGHSAQATMPWNFAAWNPDRTLCVISYKGDAPRTNLCGYGRSNVEWGRTRNIDGIPGLMVMGEYEWWTARLLPALAFRMMYPQSCISFLGDAGRGHFDVSDRTTAYVARFIEKSLEIRMDGDSLKKVDPSQGWLAQSWHPGEACRHQTAPASEYKGCRHEAFWYFDGEMAGEAERRYAETFGKKASYLTFAAPDGSLYRYDPKGHCKINGRITPDARGQFKLRAVFADSTRTEAVSVDGREIRIRAVSGPVIQLDDSTFMVDTAHPSWSNPRRAGKITVCAESSSTADCKEAVQEMTVTVPYPEKK